MAGTIQLTFQTQALDFSPLTRGAVTVKYKPNGGSTLDLTLNLAQSVPVSFQFQEVAWVDGLSGEDASQAANFAAAFRRDFRDIGGLPNSKNLTATAVGNVVTITAVTGTFEAGSNYSGNVLIVGVGAASNTPEDPTPVISLAEAGTGTCSVINYNVSAGAGTAPFELRINGVVQLAGWDGLSTQIALARGAVSKISLQDANALDAEPIYQNVPRRVLASNFDIGFTPQNGSADLTVTWPAPVAGVTPMEYALTAADAVAGSGWQTSNVFPAVLDGTYLLWVRDKYGCEDSRTITVLGYSDPTAPDTRLKYFLVSDFNSLSFSRRSSGRKNYDTALSFEENVGLPKVAFFDFTADDEIQTQFKSSYPFHQITLFKCDGTKEDLNFLMTQENIGVTEKVDCISFAVSASVAGFYFTGGNAYEPGTLTVSGTSPYQSGLPSWAQVGQFITLGTLGAREITGIGYDSDLGVLYFTVDGVATPGADTVQVTYNRHPYNVFRCDFPMSKVTGRAFVRIEAGFSSSEMEVSYQSEPIRRITDTSRHLRIQWSGFKNLGDFLFVDGYQGVMWIRGKARPFPVGSAKTFEGTDEVYSLDQSHRMGQRVSIPLMTPKQWNKFGLVSAIAEGGTLLIEDMELVRTGPIEAEELGDSNYSNVECEFAYTGEGLNEVKGEVVLNPSTGVEGGGGTGKSPVSGWDGFQRLQLADGTFIRFDVGALISLD